MKLKRSYFSSIIIFVIFSSAYIRAQKPIGVEQGDYAAWEFSSHSFDSRKYFLRTYEDPWHDLSNYNINMTITSVDGENVTCKFSNVIPQVSFNINDVKTTQTFFLYPSNLAKGDTIKGAPFYHDGLLLPKSILDFDSMSFNITSSDEETVLGSVRKLNHVDVEEVNTYDYDSGSERLTKSVEMSFDAETGILIESRYLASVINIPLGGPPSIMYFDSSRIVIKETNAWKNEVYPNEYIIYHIIGVLVVALITGVLILRKWSRKVDRA